MAIEQQPLDITAMPELAQLVDAVRASRRPRVLQRANEDVALNVPLTSAVRTPAPYNPALEAVLAGLPDDDPIKRTAGALHTDQPFVGYDQETALAEAAIAAEAVASWEDA